MLSAVPVGDVPVCDVDLYDAAINANPYDAYRAIRDAGPVVWLPATGVWAMGRYADVRAALRDHELFSSASGPAVNETANQAAGLLASCLISDPPEHETFRKVIAPPLRPGSMRALESLMTDKAIAVVEGVLGRRSFDGVAEFAQVLPLTVVRSLVGLPSVGQENMLRWGTASFESFGPDSPRTRDAIDDMGQALAFVFAPDLAEHCDPHGWAAGVFDAAARGDITETQGPSLLLDYMNPSLDTTIGAISHLLRLLADNPDQWDLLRADPTLIPHAINEALRIESPVRGFSRVVTADHRIDEVTLPQGARVLMLFGSANRDERKWTGPEQFDITRKPSDQLGFGFGIHACVGMNLARLEMRCLLEAMIPRVARIDVDTVTMSGNQVLHVIESMNATFTPATCSVAP
ncbi:MAG: cytochrome P450 [Mycobacterium sp.]